MPREKRHPSKSARINIAGSQVSAESTDLFLPDFTNKDVTSWQVGLIPEEEGSSASASNLPPSTTAWALLGNLASGVTRVDWTNIFALVSTVLFVATIGFIFYLFSRDNELGRLQSPDGFKQSGLKALGVFVPILVILILFWGVRALAHVPHRNLGGRNVFVRFTLWFILSLVLISGAVLIFSRIIALSANVMVILIIVTSVASATLLAVFFARKLKA
jgi:hypothetical protein